MASGLENVGLGQTGHIKFHWGTSWALVFLRSLTRDGETHSGPINQLESLKKRLHPSGGELHRGEIPDAMSQ